jgi:HEPN domain-containing protein
MQNDIFKKWIYFAEQDLNFAKSGLKDKFYSHVCFLSQQTVEKSCKAFLIYNNLNYPKTHKIVEILNSDKKLLDLLKEFIDEIKLLDAFYIPTRYPDGIPGSLTEGLPDKKDAESSLSIAEKIFNVMKEEISLER